MNLNDRSCSIKLIICGAKARQRSPIAKIIWQSIHLRTFGNDVSVHLHVRTDSGSRGKKLSRVGKGFPDMYVAFCFGKKLAILGGNQHSCSSKFLDWSFLCLTYGKMFGNKFLKLCLFPDHAFGHTPTTT